MNTWSGLPTHPLVVHAPIVLLPLLALATIAIALRSEWRQRFGLAVAIGDFLLIGLLLFANHTGEFLMVKLQYQKVAHEHQNLAETTRNLAALMFLGCGFVVGAGRWSQRKGSGSPSWLKPLTAVASAVTVLVAVVTTVWLFRTGHAGAKIVYDGVLKNN